MKTAAQQQPESTGAIIHGAPEGEDARILAAKARAAGTLIHIAQDDTRLAALSDLLAFFAPEIENIRFPAWDCLPYDRVSPNGDIVAQRIAALTRLLARGKEQGPKPLIVLTTVNAATQKIMPRAALAKAAFTGSAGARIDLEAFKSYLAQNGYLRTETVREPGEYAMRGGIIDLFPPGYDEPVRMDLFGDEIETLRHFDPATQLTTSKIETFTLQPVAEFFLDEESIARFRAAYREKFGVISSDDPLYAAVSEGRRYNGMEHWLPLFHETMETLFDYVGDAALTLDQHALEARKERLAQIEDFYQARKTLEESGARKNKKEFSGAIYHPLPADSLYLLAPWPPGETLSPFAAPGSEEQPAAKKGRDFADIRALPDGDVFGELKRHINFLINEKVPSPLRGEGQGEGAKNGAKTKPSAEAIAFARDLRAANTEAEKKLWAQLRDRRVKGCKFRRQHPIEPYTVDFICLEKKLVVELDGPQHDQRHEYDEERTRSLEKKGFRILRFSNSDIDANLEGIVETIGNALDVIDPLTPTLSPKGRGGTDSDFIEKVPSPLRGEGQGEGAKKDRKILIAAYSEGSAVRLKGLMEHAGIKITDCPDYASVERLQKNQIGLAVLGLERGFTAPDLAIITEQDILGDRLARRARRKKRADNFLTEVSSLSEGDLVVHVDHGVGRFVALETLEAAGALHDCLKVEYAGGDRLYVPVENIEVLSRFGSDEGTVQLDKLGGAGWQARKARVKKDLMEMAGKLLDVAAARKLRRAEPLQIDDAHYNEFAARFPYTETDDQQRAINDVLDSISGDYPMDRLVCGDVGFGKTEVALRAAYVAAMSGAQVAVAVPTTLLARQHHRNFTERFKGTGLRVEQLSRLVSARDAESVKKGLADGTINIVIGTHALFGQGVRFANLGLLIVDEEQRFGVKQKERLKELKNNVHVLTLTATPIPRTLQMALTGVKEMSLIATPPVDRLAVRTFVLPFDPVVIREAILREHYRGGQSFYVCPRIKDIKEVEEQLKELVPEVKLISAHGQMTPADLEDRMSAFYDGQYDVLLATNIIENGLDIPTANTMIVHRADMFGLSQLYQIRGRIGRSKLRAYAYLTYAPNMLLNPQAQKRLEVIETLDTLGAGFQLASHDMDIRGAGNLLGEQQSGHIREIGVELYQQMLEEAVAAAREGTGEAALQEERWSPQINLGTSVLIPETYVEDLNVRMSLYRRLSDLKDKDDIESFAAELIDRFGDLPEEVENLLDIVAIKQLCIKAGIAQVEAGPKGAVIGFRNNAPPKPESVLSWVAQKRGTVKLRPDQKLVAVRSWDSLDHRVSGIRALVKELASL